MRKKKKSNEELVYEYQQEKNPEKKKRIADELYRKAFRLVAKYAGTFPNIAYGTQEDLIQEASLIFMRCINKFDVSKNLKFSTYLGKACKYELRRYKDKQRKHIDNSYYLEIDEIIQAKPEDVDNQIDTINDLSKIQNIVIDLYKNEQITKKQFETIIDVHGFLGRDRKTRKEIAEDKNCSLQNVGFLYRKALNKIKEELIKRNIEYKI